MINPVRAEAIMFLAILFCVIANLYITIGIWYLLRKIREKQEDIHND